MSDIANSPALPALRRDIARDISYAGSVAEGPARSFVRVVENATGRRALLRRASGYDAQVAAGRDFWQVMMERYRLRLVLREGSLDAIPPRGPLVVIANHPFGILDGLVMGHILSAMRGDFHILAHRVFETAPEIAHIILPIDFSGTAAAHRTNITTRSRAVSFLREGGAIGVFPGGTVATGSTPFARPLDPVWRNFPAKMIRQSGATVLPIWFDGYNSRLFQLASHINYTLRMSLLLREFRARVDRPVSLAIGRPILPGEIAQVAGESKVLMDFLRARTYKLAEEPLDPASLGREFEKAYRH